MPPHRIQVAAQDFRPVLETHFSQAGVSGDAGIIDQDVDLAAVAFQAAHQ
jgi:hypothetical protein